MQNTMRVLLHPDKDNAPFELFISEWEKEFLFKSDSITYDGIKYKINEFVFDFSNNVFNKKNTVSLYCERI